VDLITTFNEIDVVLIAFNTWFMQYDGSFRRYLESDNKFDFQYRQQYLYPQ